MFHDSVFLYFLARARCRIRVRRRRARGGLINLPADQRDYVSSGKTLLDNWGHNFSRATITSSHKVRRAHPAVTRAA